MKASETPRRLLALMALLGAGAGAGAAQSAGWTNTDLGPVTTGQMALNDQGWVVVGNRVLTPTTAGYATTLVRSTDGSLNNLRLTDSEDEAEFDSEETIAEQLVSAGIDEADGERRRDY